MKILITLIFLSLIGCGNVNQRGESVVKSGPFTTIEKHPDQEKNLEEAPEWLEPCEWVVPGTISGSACEKKEDK